MLAVHGLPRGRLPRPWVLHWRRRGVGLHLHRPRSARPRVRGVHATARVRFARAWLYRRRLRRRDMHVHLHRLRVSRRCRCRRRATRCRTDGCRAAGARHGSLRLFRSRLWRSAGVRVRHRAVLQHDFVRGGSVGTLRADPCDVHRRERWAGLRLRSCDVCERVRRSCGGHRRGERMRMPALRLLPLLLLVACTSGSVECSPFGDCVDPVTGCLGHGRCTGRGSEWICVCADAGAPDFGIGPLDAAPDVGAPDLGIDAPADASVDAGRDADLGCLPRMDCVNLDLGCIGHGWCTGVGNDWDCVCADGGPPDAAIECTADGADWVRTARCRCGHMGLHWRDDRQREDGEGEALRAARSGRARGGSGDHRRRPTEGEARRRSRASAVSRESCSPAGASAQAWTARRGARACRSRRPGLTCIWTPRSS